jgi:pyruvate dehydrogenase E1 component beta subunit
VRAGRDVTVVATQQMRHRAVEAAAALASEGIELEIIDPRTLVPFDMDTVVASLGSTARLLVVQESPVAGSWGATLVARLISEHFDLFDAPPTLVSAPDSPVPYAEVLEEAWVPSVARISEAARQLVAF